MTSSLDAVLAGNAAVCESMLDSDNSLLPSSETRALLLAGDILWIGTAAGLVSYDTTTQVMVLYPDQLSDTAINDIVADGSDLLWLATDAGVSRMNLVTGSATSFDSSDLGFNGDSNILAVYVDGSGTKWLATNVGVVRYTGP